VKRIARSLKARDPERFDVLESAPEEGAQFGLGALTPLPSGLEGQELQGGLVFSGFRKPGGDALGLWINALFVAPEHRRKRIASQLIRAAEMEAFRTEEGELFALTNIPKLYEDLGWQRVESSVKGIVLRAVLTNE
jgi:GNAT superfamily N-acetyltransferase